jgi:hypothetical protein
MKVKLLGYREASFKSDSGEMIEGTSLFISYPMTGSNEHGEEAEKRFIRKGSITMPALKVGASYAISFNGKGKLMSISAA